MAPNNQSHKYYFDRPEIWENHSQERFYKEARFLAEIFTKRGAIENILDVGCGTGTHLNHLTTMGFRGMGIDLNESMIEYASKRYSHIEFKVQDMREIEFSNQFDALICLCTTFSYNTTNADVFSTLKRFNKALNINGVLVLDLFNTIGLIEKNAYKKEIIDPSNAYADFNLRREVHHCIHTNEQLMEENMTFFDLITNKVVKNDLSVGRLFFPQELVFFLEQTGFENIEFYDGYNLDKHKLQGERMLMTATKSSHSSN